MGTGRARAQPSCVERQRRKQPVPATESRERGLSGILQRCGTRVCVMCPCMYFEDDEVMSVASWVDLFV